MPYSGMCCLSFYFIFVCVFLLLKLKVFDGLNNRVGSVVVSNWEVCWAQQMNERLSNVFTVSNDSKNQSWEDDRATKNDKSQADAKQTDAKWFQAERRWTQAHTQTHTLLFFKVYQYTFSFYVVICTWNTLKWITWDNSFISCNIIL